MPINFQVFSILDCNELYTLTLKITDELKKMAVQNPVVTPQLNELDVRLALFKMAILKSSRNEKILESNKKLEEFNDAIRAFTLYLMACQFQKNKQFIVSANRILQVVENLFPSGFLSAYNIKPDLILLFLDELQKEETRTNIQSILAERWVDELVVSGKEYLREEQQNNVVEQTGKFGNSNEMKKEITDRIASLCMYIGHNYGFYSKSRNDELIASIASLLIDAKKMSRERRTLSTSVQSTTAEFSI